MEVRTTGQSGCLYHIVHNRSWRGGECAGHERRGFAFSVGVETTRSGFLDSVLDCDLIL